MGKTVSGYLFCLVLFYIQGHEVDLRCGVWGGSLDKNLEKFLWISVSVCHVNVHILNSHTLHLPAQRPSRNMRGSVTLGVEADRPSFSLAAEMGPKPV